MNLNNGDLMAHAFRQGRAFPVMFFVAQDAPPSRFVITDAIKHFDAIVCPCNSERPSIRYSMDKRPYSVDGTEHVAVGCDDCRRGVTLVIGAPLFNKARGAMGSVCRSWWNAMVDKAAHPDDHGAHGGMVVTWEDFDGYMRSGAKGGDDQPGESPKSEGAEG